MSSTSDLIKERMLEILKAQLEHEKPDKNKESIWYQVDESAMYRMFYDNGAWRVAKYKLFQERIIE